MFSKQDRSKEALRNAWRKHYPKDEELRGRISRTLCQWILASEEFDKAKAIAVFSPRSWEIDLMPLWKAAGDRVAFPRTNFSDHSLRFYRISSQKDLTPAFAGILEPKADPALEITQWRDQDLILVPGYAFDWFGGRVGSGAGFYDRFLAKLPSGVHKWGVAFAQQVLKDKLAQIPTDVRMDAIVTEFGIEPAEKEDTE